MKYKFTIYIAHAFMLTQLFASWMNTFGGIYDEVGYSLAIEQDGYVIAGKTYSFSIEYPELYVLKVNLAGECTWQQTYGPGLFYSTVTVSDRGNISSGYTFMPCKYCLVLTDNNGDSLWKKAFGDDIVQSGSFIIETSNGTLLALWHPAPDGHNALVMRISEDGDSIWSRLFGYETGGGPLSFIQTYNGDFLMAGSALTGIIMNDAFFMKIDSLGDSVWMRIYGTPGNDWCGFVDTTGDSHYISVGSTSLYYDILFDIYLLKINDDGDTLWTRKIGGPDQSDIGRCVRPTTDGGYIITGWTYSYGIGTPDSSNVYLVKTDSLGIVQWERTFGGTGEDKGYSVSQTDDGGYIIAGVYDQGPQTDVYLIKTDSLGEVDWVREVPTKPQEITINAYPNPFNDVCDISIVGAYNYTPKIEIYDLRGNIVSSLTLGPSPAERERDVSFSHSMGEGVPTESGRMREFTWHPAPSLPSGVYLVKATVGKQIITKKVVMIR